MNFQQSEVRFVASTTIKISVQDGYFVADVLKAPFAQGDSVTIYADPGADTMLCIPTLSADFIGAITVPAGDSVTLTSAASQPANNCVLLQAAGSAFPTAAEFANAVGSTDAPSSPWIYFAADIGGGVSSGPDDDTGPPPPQ